MAEENKSKRKWANWVLLGCVLPLGLIVILFVGLAIWFSMPAAEKTESPEFIEQNAKAVDEKVAQLAGKIDKNDYDIDQTVMSLFSIEKALAEAKDFKGLTSFILQKDSDKVAPEVAELKYRFFDIYKNLLDARDELEEQESIYNVTSGTLLDIVSTVDYTTLSYDQGQAKKIWTNRLHQANLKDNVLKRLRREQDRLIDFYFDYLKINVKYLKEWNKLCAVRDRAYLAVYEKDWKEVLATAAEAAKLAPYEREARTLLAMAQLEEGGETGPAIAKSIVNEMLEKHQGQPAPAYLLRGVVNMKSKNFDQAIIDFDQAAAYFPKQQEDLSDHLNLYKKRRFLNKSKEGRMIINIYRSVMTGSGYFSPDFQKARIYLMKGEKEKAKAKIFDHFSRRRLQGQWDKVLADFQYCQSFLAEDLQEVFAGDKIDLEIESAFFTNSVIVTIHNGGDSDLHNITVLLCVRFTDMFKGDYISFTVGKTEALLKAGKSVTVGRRNISEITKEKLGMEKSFKDIIEYAAVLISDEAITWVDAKPADVKQTEDPAQKKEEEASTKEYIKDSLSKAINSAVDAWQGKKKDDPNKTEKDPRSKIVEKIVDKAVDKATETDKEPEKKKSP